jgi:hypothetical protein
MTQLGEGGFDLSSLVNCADSPPGARAKLYYPATTTGKVACGQPFPLIIYVHGRRNDCPLCDWSHPGPTSEDYHQAEGLLRRLAAAGVLVISVDVSWVQSDDISKGAIIVNALAYALGENARSGALLQGAVNPARVGLMGHSTGGSGAIRAAA